MTRDWELVRMIKSLPCFVCSRRPVDAAHIKSRGTGGPDTDWNLVPFCRYHHDLQHAKGWVAFLDKHPAVKWHLQSKGWQVIELGDGSRRMFHSLTEET